MIGGLQNEQSYWFAVVAVNALGSGSQSPEVTAMPPGWLGTRQFGSAGDDGLSKPYAATDGDVFAVGGLDTLPTIWRFDERGDLLSSVTLDPSIGLYDVAGGSPGVYVGGLQGSNSFLAALNATGGIAFSTGAPGGTIRGIAFDASADLFAVGYASSPYYGQSGPGSLNAFISRYSPDGTEHMTVMFGTTAGASATAIAVDRSQHELCVAGETAGALGGTYSGNGDAFVARYAETGGRKWAAQIGTSESDEANAVAVDDAGNCYVAGGTRGFFSSYAGQTDVFVAKYDAFGSRIWLKQWGTQEIDEAYGIGVEQDGTVVVSGVGGTDAVGAAAGESLFLLRLDSDGDVLSALTVPKPDATTYVSGSALSIDTHDFIYVGGSAAGPFGVDPPLGNYDAILAKFDPQGHLLTIY